MTANSTYARLCPKTATTTLLSIFIATATAALLPAAMHADELPTEWDLSPIIADLSVWEAEFAAVAEPIAAIARHRELVANGPAELEAYLLERDALWQRLSRIGTWASLNLSTDVRDPDHRSRSARMRNRYADLGKASSWFRPLIVELGEAFVRRALAERPALAPYQRELEYILMAAPHTLSEETEQAIALLNPLWRSASTVYSTFMNADFPAPKLTLANGESIEIHQSLFPKYRRLPNRNDRKAVFETFWSGLNAYENTIGETYYANVQSAVASSRLRKHPSALAQSLFNVRLPVEIYTTLVDEVHASLPQLHRYMRLRDRLMRLRASNPDAPEYASPFAYYDIYQPLVEHSGDYSFAKSVDLLRRAAAPLGKTYNDLLEYGLAGAYTHVYPRRGKRSGAFMSSGVYGEHPFVFLNHTDDFNSASTLAHEWGHAIHSILSNDSQPYPIARYSLFIAEIAAFANEYLLLEYMQHNAQSLDDQLFFLLEELEHYRGSFFRQTKFAEFELLAHTEVENNRPLTGQSLSNLYGGLLRRYYGHDEGVTAIDPIHFIEWSYIPHFYSNFYVYNYATSTAAARYFISKIVAGDSAVLDAYLNLLRAGGSDDAYRLLIHAGLDMHTPAAYAALRERMDYLIDRIERLLANR